MGVYNARRNEQALTRGHKRFKWHWYIDGQLIQSACITYNYTWSQRVQSPINLSFHYEILTVQSATLLEFIALTVPRNSEGNNGGIVILDGKGTRTFLKLKLPRYFERNLRELQLNFLSILIFTSRFFYISSVSLLLT